MEKIWLDPKAKNKINISKRVIDIFKVLIDKDVCIKVGDDFDYFIKINLNVLVYVIFSN